MTKPKTVKELLTEANKLARERCECNNLKIDHVVRVENGSWELILKGARNYMQISTWDDALSMRCLIAALREVPVVKRGKR